MTKPDGFINPGLSAPEIRGYVTRNPQQLAPGLFVVEAQQGKTGKGRVWRPALVKDGIHAGHVRPAQSKYRQGMWHATLRSSGTYMEGFFHTEAAATQFLVGAARFLP